MRHAGLVNFLLVFVFPACNYKMHYRHGWDHIEEQEQEGADVLERLDDHPDKQTQITAERRKVLNSADQQTERWDQQPEVVEFIIFQIVIVHEMENIKHDGDWTDNVEVIPETFEELFPFVRSDYLVEDSQKVKDGENEDPNAEGLRVVEVDHMEEKLELVE